MRFVVAVVVCVGCGFTHGSSSGGGADARGDTLRDARDGGAFPTGPFSTPQLVAVSAPTTRDDDVTLTADMLEMYFESDRVALGDGDIYVVRRAAVTDLWSLPARVDELSTTALESSMEISSDGLTMYFSSNRASSTIDIYVTTRPDRGSPWTNPVLVAELSSNAGDYNAQPWSDTLLYLGSNRQPARGGSDVFRTTRASASAAWGTPEVVPGLDTFAYEGEAFADAAEAIWFTGDASGTLGPEDIWRSEPNGDGSYKPAVRVPELASAQTENDPWLSPDGRTIYFTSNRAGSLDIYMATR